MRLLVATLRYPPYVAGGYELLTRDAVEGLRARGHEVQVLCGRGEALEGLSEVLPWLEPRIDQEQDLFERSFRANNVERFRLHVLSPANLRASRRALRASRADVLLYFNLGLVSIAPIFAARSLGVPAVGFASDPWPLNHWLLAWEERGEKPLRGAWLGGFWRRFRELAGLSSLLACSAHLRARLVAGGYAEHEVEVLHLGVPPRVEARTRDREPRHRVTGEPLRVLCSSMHWRGKGVHLLLEAAARACAAGAELELVLPGSGPEEYARELADLAAAPALAGRVRFPGMLELDELDELYAASHVLVFPSLWPEPFALANLEALAHGLCVLASDAGGSPEQIEDGESGRILPAGDVEALARALVEVAGDEPRRFALARAGQQRARARFRHARFLDGLELSARAALRRGCG